MTDDTIKINSRSYYLSDSDRRKINRLTGKTIPVGTELKPQGADNGVFFLLYQPGKISGLDLISGVRVQVPELDPLPYPLV